MQKKKFSKYLVSLLVLVLYCSIVPHAHAATGYVNRGSSSSGIYCRVTTDTRAAIVKPFYLTCQENILLPTLYKRISAPNRFDELVELLDISYLLSQRVNVLSGGEKQRVALARSLILDPCLLLADEPTGNLDPKNRDIVLNLIQRESNKGRGVVLITHDMNVAKLGETILCLNEGKLYDL